MSNFYSCLGDSDDEESPKLSKPTAGSTGKTEDKKKSAPAKAAPGGKTGAKPKPAPAQGPAPGVDMVVTKASERGAREAGGHGPKQRSENRNRRARNDKTGSMNNMRRGGDPEMQGRRNVKGGSGAHNWGNESEDANKANKTGKFDADDVVDEERVAAPVEPEPEPEPEPVTFTLEEYRAQRKAAQTNSEIFGKVKERKVTDEIEGVKLSSQIEDFLVIGGLKENKTAKSKSNKGRQVVDLTFANASLDKSDERDERRRSDNRHPDGSARTHRGSGRGKGPRIDVSDKSMFPSL